MIFLVVLLLLTNLATLVYFSIKIKKVYSEFDRKLIENMTNGDRILAKAKLIQNNCKEIDGLVSEIKDLSHIGVF